MQYMYLRRKGKKNNPGRHPIGMIGVQRMKDGSIAVGVLTLHSDDRFDKKTGRQLMFPRIYKDPNRVLPVGGNLPDLTTMLPETVLRRLDSPGRHQEILDTLILDEGGGTLLDRAAMQGRKASLRG